MKEIWCFCFVLSDKFWSYGNLFFLNFENSVKKGKVLLNLKFVVFFLYLKNLIRNNDYGYCICDWIFKL